jgi:hypothetical protein
MCFQYPDLGDFLNLLKIKKKPNLGDSLNFLFSNTQTSLLLKKN